MTANVITVNSSTLDIQDNVTAGTFQLEQAKDSGKLRVAIVEHTVPAGDHAANQVIGMYRLPPGPIVIFPKMSRIIASAQASVTFDIGYADYEDAKTGDTTDGVLDAIEDNVSATSAIDAFMGAAGNALDYVEIDSMSGVVITAKVLGATYPENDAIELHIVYASKG